MAHIVKCTVCGGQFDRDKVQAVKSGARRYAHYTCLPSGEKVAMPQVDEELTKLIEYAQQLLGKDYNAARVKKQIKDFKEEYGYSYSGMMKSLVYFYEVKGNSKDKANGGIGIVPFVYNDAYNYYLNLFLANQQNINKDVKSCTSKVKEITIKVPIIEFSKKLFNLDDDEVEDEQTE